MVYKHGPDSPNYKHGKNTNNSGEYRSWSNMKDRCLNNNNKDFKRYSDRGITVCERWRNSFENFLADMGPRPSLKHSVDRIDNDKGYSPENCRWGTKSEQSRNRSRIKTNTSGFTGVNYCKVMKKWRAQIGVNGTSINLGYFDTLHNAVATRWIAEALYWN